MHAKPALSAQSKAACFANSRIRFRSQRREAVLRETPRSFRPQRLSSIVCPKKSFWDAWRECAPFAFGRAGHPSRCSGPRSRWSRVQEKSTGLLLVEPSGFVPSRAQPTNTNAPRGGVCICWWSRRESNPRPHALYRPLYILRVHYLISPRRRQWSGCYSASHLNLTFYQVARQKAILVNDSAVSCDTRR